MRPVDDWDPLSLEAAEGVFIGAPFRWWVCGGFALEFHVGRSWRSHEDLDIGILRADATRVYSWLADWDLWVADARATLAPWHGDPLDPERGENNVWARTSESSWRFDLTVGGGNDAEWIYRRDERIRRDWDAAVLRTTDGLPYLAPELQLLFKSKNPRPKDDVDAQLVVPLLDAGQRTFLADHLDSDHPWHHLTRFDPNADLPVQVVAGLLRKEGQALLCHRRADRDHYPDVWDLPGGRVEPGETLPDALTRELEEELGILARLSGETPWLTLTNDTLQFHIYLIDEWQGEPNNMAPEEHDEIIWTSASEVGEFALADSSYVQILKRALA